MKNLIILLLLFLPFIGVSQNISGFVNDKKTGERLENAHVYTINPFNGISSNYYGYYNLVLKGFNADSVVIYCSYVGYKTFNKTLKTTDNLSFQIELESDNILDEVIVKATRNRANDVVDIPIKKLKATPMVFGEIDINKSLQFLPGIGSGMEGSSGLHVRGGSPDQNLVLLDDAVIFNSSHFANLLSVFNPDAIKSYKIYKGFIPAKYGERVSSVLDIKMKDGNINEHKGSANIGMISSGFLFEGPLKNNKVSYLISGRIFNYGLFTQNTDWFAYTAIDGYKFYDINAKLNFILSDKDRLMVSFYNGRDISDLKIIQSEDHTENLKNTWGNSLVSVRWNHIFKSNLFSNTSLSVNNYQYELELTKNIDSTIINSSDLKIPELRFKSDFEYKTKKNQFSFGGGYTLFNYQTRIENIQKNNLYNNHFYGYLSDEYKITEKITVNAGLRTTVNFNSDTSYFHLEPRLLINLKIGKSDLDFIYTRINQNLQHLSNQSGSRPVEYWIPTNQNIAPVSSQQVAINFKRALYQEKLNLTLSSYFKYLQNLVWVKENQSFSGFRDLSEIDLETGGIGKSYGFELLLDANFQKINGWIGYTYSKSRRKFNVFNNGMEFPYDFDRSHNIDVFIAYRINKKWNMNVTWEYGSGFPITTPTVLIHYIPYTYIDSQNESSSTFLYYESKNNERMEAYHKLDIGFNYKNTIKRGIINWRFGINNVYNRMNPYYYKFYINDNFSQLNKPIDVIKVSMFPIMPYIGFKWEF